MKIVLCHGMGTGPKGPKYHSLCEAFGEDNVIAPDCEGVYDLGTRLEIVKNAVGDTKDLIFVGSSFGGLVSVTFASKYPDQVKGYVLCNPALGMRPKPRSLPKKAVILHAIDDEVIHISTSEMFSMTTGIPLIRVPDEDHKLDKSHKLIVDQVRGML